MTQTSGYTGYRRQRATRSTVRLGDTLARRVIIAGGIGTIVAVSTVCIYLVYVVLPLFQSPTVSEPTASDAPSSETIRRLYVDDYHVLGWSIASNATVSVFRADTSKPIAQHAPQDAPDVTAIAVSDDGLNVIVGYADGHVRLGTIRPTVTVLSADQVPSEHQNLQAGAIAQGPTGLITRSADTWRQHNATVTFADPVAAGDGQPVTLIAEADRASQTLFAALTKDNILHLRAVREQENLMTGEIIYHLSGGDTPIDMPLGMAPPSHMLMSGNGDNVFLVWPDGHLIRINTLNRESPRIVEQVDLVPHDGATLTAVQFLLGGATLLTGDSSGRVQTWFRIRTDQAAEHADGWQLVSTHALPGREAAVTSLGGSQRTRIAAVGFSDGHVRLYHVTSEALLADVAAPNHNPVTAIAVAPREDRVYARIDHKLWHWDIDLKHPEANVTALFAPVWYEGAPEPEYVWQSSSGDDAFEPKLSLIPLIFGTIKATVYALIFGVPMALLAAVYSSEFLHAKLRARIKPTIELMASLPSVVLGFLAALVIAPFIDNRVATVLTCIVTAPAMLVLGAYLWQLLPGTLIVRLNQWRLAVMGVALVVGLFIGIAIGPTVEQWCFAGDIKAWLDGQQGTGTAGWLMLLLPLTAIVIAVATSLKIDPMLRPRIATMSRSQTALLQLGKFLIMAVGTLGVAWAASWTLTHAGWDPRGGASYIGTYTQRNALIVGFMMGFAIIPIIYTIAEDALTAVPEHLRAGSLGAGATPWQTAVRIVIPTAMSGLFSAIMIGLGRAVGETMIVLMAAGNTPIMEWNIFNGMRTLATNIAVELPEAPQHSTHYRTLFLAALVLFAMTFLINTAAEAIRLRFRKRAGQL